MRPRAYCGVLALLILAGGTADGGQDWLGQRRSPAQDAAYEPYDGRVTFARIRYAMGFGGYGRRGGEPPWAHDYPIADIHMMRILNELTLLRPRIDGSNVFSLSDPELHRHPIAYMSEPGFWNMDEEEVLGLRSYLAKGGFIIFDDFRGHDWDNLVDQMRRAVPEGQWVQLDSTHPVFHSFFEINDLEYLTSYNGMPTYWGMFEDNDQRKRLIALANRDNDLGEYWEYSDTGYAPVDLSNQAYKFGINYFIYALTH
ncbi:hypothetical protein BH24ACI4_BH24ACI4_27640 [soil metagenome]